MIESKVLDKGLNLFHTKFQLKMIIESKVLDLSFRDKIVVQMWLPSKLTSDGHDFNSLDLIKVFLNPKLA